MTERDQADALWRLAVITWGVWVACILLSLALHAIWAPLGYVPIAVGLLLIVNFGIRVASFSFQRRARRARKDA